jgi:hypothetical protein
VTVLPFFNALLAAFRKRQVPESLHQHVTEDGDVCAGCTPVFAILSAVALKSQFNATFEFDESDEVFFPHMLHAPHIRLTFLCV